MSSFSSASNKPAWRNTFNPPGVPATPGVNASGMLQLDIFEWYPAYQSCQRYFLRHAQYDSVVQAVAALTNIRLPFQWPAAPVSHGTVPLTHLAGSTASNLLFKRAYSMENPQSQPTPAWVSLVPYIQRLMITGMDKEGIMHGFFGDDWKEGIGPIHENERCNYMFAAKSTEWTQMKYLYDISPHESVPSMIPLQNIHIHEVENAETKWSRWLAMEDWMLGPRAPGWEDKTAKACRWVPRE